jgi:oligoribonuclease NrnB/cAMP/cGMP phosphodiesterase (DHH superfamily)
MASSATSISDIAPIVLDSATEMVNLLVKDQQLRDLLDESFKLLQSEKVTRNFRRALHSFSKELLLEAQMHHKNRLLSLLGKDQDKYQYCFAKEFIRVTPCSSRVTMEILCAKKGCEISSETFNQGAHKIAYNHKRRKTVSKTIMVILMIALI